MNSKQILIFKFSFSQLFKIKIKKELIAKIGLTPYQRKQLAKFISKNLTIWLIAKHSIPLIVPRGNASINY